MPSPPKPPILGRNYRRLKRTLWRRPAPVVVTTEFDEELTYVDEPALTEVFETLRAIERRGAEGMLIEAGCALGGSAIVVAAGNSVERPLNVYGAFGTILPLNDKR